MDTGKVHTKLAECCVVKIKINVDHNHEMRALGYTMSLVFDI